MTIGDLERSAGIEQTPDRTLIEQHGWEASIARDGDGWIIDPRGRASIRPQPDKVALF